MTTLTDAFTLRTAATDSHGSLLLLASCDEIDEKRQSHTCVFLIENDTMVDKLVLAWQSSGVVSLGPKKFIVFGEEGHYLVYTAGQLREGYIWNETQGQHKFGIMRAGGAGASQVCWVGFNGRAAILDIQGRWIQVTQGFAGDYEGVVPMPDRSFLAYGWHGRVARTRGTQWTNVDVPTNVILTNGCICPDGRVVLVGQDGIILRSSNEIWEILVENETNQDFWGVACFEGRLYASTMQFIYEVEDEETLTLVQFTDGLPETYYHLIASETQMWSIGNKSLFQLSGGVWRDIVLPDPR